MKEFIGFILIVVGLIPLIYLTIKEEDGKTFTKIMVAAICGEWVDNHSRLCGKTVCKGSSGPAGQSPLRLPS